MIISAFKLRKNNNNLRTIYTIQQKIRKKKKW